MQIIAPRELVIDVSMWNHHLNIYELLDGGVTSVILGLYKQWVNGKAVLNTNCRRIADQIAASPLVMQAYYYYYPQCDPIIEADWFVNQIFVNGYPVKFAWADCEDHGAPMDMKLRSEQYRRFTQRLHDQIPKSGVYTAKWFTDAYAPEMKLWLGKYWIWTAEYEKEPAKVTPMDWYTLQSFWMPDYELHLAPGMIPQQVVGHQFTGDRCILPGVYQQYLNIYGGRQPLDVSVFSKTFMIWMLNNLPIPTPPVVTPTLPPHVDYKVNAVRINIRATSSSTGAWVRYADKGTVLHVISPMNMTNGYVQLTDGTWAFFVYLIKV